MDIEFYQLCRRGWWLIIVIVIAVIVIAAIDMEKRVASIIIIGIADIEYIGYSIGYFLFSFVGPTLTEINDNIIVIPTLPLNDIEV